MARQSTKEEKKEYIAIIQPRTDNADALGYAKINGKIFPFGRKVKLDKNDLYGLQNQKEAALKNKSGVDVHQVMNDLKVNQETANRIARTNDGQMQGTNNIKWVNKYIVTLV